MKCRLSIVSELTFSPNVPGVGLHYLQILSLISVGSIGSFRETFCSSSFAVLSVWDIIVAMV